MGLEVDDNQYDVTKGNISKRDVMELIYVPVAIILFFAAKHLIVANITDESLLKKAEMQVFLCLWGLFHICASRIMSFLYNLGRIIMPVTRLRAPKATPRRLKTLGAVVIAISIILLLL